MTYDQEENLKPAEFKRLCGVQLETFKQMVDIVTLAPISLDYPLHLNC